MVRIPREIWPLTLRPHSPPPRRRFGLPPVARTKTLLRVCCRLVSIALSLYPLDVLLLLLLPPPTLLRALRAVLRACAAHSPVPPLESGDRAGAEIPGALADDGDGEGGVGAASVGNAESESTQSSSHEPAGQKCELSSTSDERGVDWQDAVVCDGASSSDGAEERLLPSRRAEAVAKAVPGVCRAPTPRTHLSAIAFHLLSARCMRAPSWFSPHSKCWATCHSISYCSLRAPRPGVLSRVRGRFSRASDDQSADEPADSTARRIPRSEV